MTIKRSYLEQKCLKMIKKINQKSLHLFHKQISLQCAKSQRRHSKTDKINYRERSLKFFVCLKRPALGGGEGGMTSLIFKKLKLKRNITNVNLSSAQFKTSLALLG